MKELHYNFLSRKKILHRKTRFSNEPFSRWIVAEVSLVRGCTILFEWKLICTNIIYNILLNNMLMMKNFVIPQQAYESYENRKF